MGNDTDGIGENEIERENNISVFITEVDSSRRLAEKYPPHSKDPVY